MMPDQEQPQAEPDNVEQREKKESADQSSQDNPDALRKQIASEKARNQKLEKVIAAEGGEDGKEKKEGSERLEELLIKELEPSMQQGLDMNVNTDFSKREPDRLRSDLARVNGSEKYVSSHTPESLGSALQRELKNAFEKYKAEQPNDATVGGMQGADSNKAIDFVKSAMLKSLQIVKTNIVKALKEKGVENPEEEQGKREASGEQVRTVRGAPSDRAIGPRGRNSMREFRNAIYKAETPDKVRYDRLTLEPPKTEAERNAAKKFNVLAEKFDDALAYCEESGASGIDKNVRAVLLKDYGNMLVKDPVTTPETLPKFKEWLAQNADKVKVAREQVTKTAE
jgi:hypothetical protein